MHLFSETIYLFLFVYFLSRISAYLDPHTLQSMTDNDKNTAEESILKQLRTNTTVGNTRDIAGSDGLQQQ